MRDLADLHVACRAYDGRLDDEHRGRAIFWYRQVLDRLPAGKAERTDAELLLAQLLFANPDATGDLRESERLLEGVVHSCPATSDRCIRGTHLLAVQHLQKKSFGEAERWCRVLLAQEEADNPRVLQEFQSLTTSAVVQAVLLRKDLKASAKKAWLEQIVLAIPPGDEFQPLHHFADQQLRHSKRHIKDRVPLTPRTANKPWSVAVIANLAFLVGLSAFVLSRRKKASV